MASTLWIHGRMPGLNELLAESRKSPYAYNKLKKTWMAAIGAMALYQRFRFEGPHWVYLFCEPNRKRDPSNLVAGAVKIIEDALVETGFVSNDGWKHVHSITTKFQVSDPCGVLLVADGWGLTWSGEQLQDLMQENEQWKKSKSQNPSPFKTTSTPSSRSRGQSSGRSKGSAVPTRSEALSALQKARSPKAIQAAKEQLKRMGLLSKSSR